MGCIMFHRTRNPLHAQWAIASKNNFFVGKNIFFCKKIIFVVKYLFVLNFYLCGLFGYGFEFG